VGRVNGLRALADEPLRAGPERDRARPGTRLARRGRRGIGAGGGHPLADCIFCRIAAGQIPADIVYQDELAVAFRDVDPQAPVHVLVIPRTHWAGLDALSPEGDALLGRLLGLCRVLAPRLGLDGGYRVVVNTGLDGGQTVGHLHLHLLGGRPMTWPPG